MGKSPRVTVRVCQCLPVTRRWHVPDLLRAQKRRMTSQHSALGSSPALAHTALLHGLSIASVLGGERGEGEDEMRRGAKR